VRLLAILEYDGTDFAGFQLQARRTPPPRTVQDELERALAICTGEEIRVIASGRTDSGVHARGQVVHFDTDARLAHDPERLVVALNSHLPVDVKVRHIRPARANFHARHSATSRRYCYRVFACRVPSPLMRRHAHHVRAALSAERMDAGARLLEGTHDFIAFAAEEGPGSTIRKVLRARVAQCPAPGGAQEPIWHTYGDSAQLIEIEVEASGFLRHMMRRIAGTLLRVGDGRLEPEDVGSIIASRDKSLAGPTAPARGLCLEAVRYPDEELQPE
jgi:tRNA pseudouridine38-40 synthase